MAVALLPRQSVGSQTPRAHYRRIARAPASRRGAARRRPGAPRSEGMMAPRTLFGKVWQDHVVREPEGEPALVYIDLHLVHEVTSPQPFESLRLNGRQVRRTDLTIATADHNVATTDRSLPVEDPISRSQLEALDRNCEEFGVRLEGALSPLMGIVHVIGPELGLTLPGMTVVCGDSHTATHGAFGAIAFGIGTSEVEHV